MVKKEKFFDKYFEAYTVEKVECNNKKGSKTVRTYNGDVYELDSTYNGFVVKKIVCAALLVLFFVFCVLSSIMDGRGSGSLVTVCLCWITLLAGCYYFKGVVDLVISRRKMTKFECEEYRKEIKIGAIISMCSSGLMTVSCLVFAVIGTGSAANEIYAAIFGALCFGCAGGIFFIEKRSKYKVTAGTYKYPKEQKRSMKINTQRDGIPELDDEDARMLF